MGARKLNLLLWALCVLFRPTSVVAATYPATLESTQSQIIELKTAPTKPTKKNKKRFGSCGFLISLAAVGAITLGYLSPAVYHNVKSEVTGVEHVGHGIYLDWGNIRSGLNDEELQILDNRDENPRAVIDMFTKKLGGTDGDEDGDWRWFPKTRYASDYLNSNNTNRGNCRHRASILAGLLNDLGIEAILQDGEIEEVGRHLWVYLPDFDLVADPYAGVTISRSEYEGGFDRNSIHRPSPLKRFVAGTFY
ncbi:MAG: hypothetical protein H6617_07245 [Bdellovibrionaceae bacterium]|nr:hypothetical protein [Bdellovibrionales bacterium]MCB0418046.1 hypothetical protein [Bdellovibrionales bacterium]MCB9254463.1 hypothetical protein [Pseudobdellovibrionaceae bacterium]